MNNSIARFQISADEDFRIQFVFVGLSLAGRTLRMLVKERASDIVRTTLTLGSGLTLDGTDTVTASVPQATAAAWARGEFETDLHDITGGSNTRLVGARTIYDLPGLLPYGVIGSQATVQWVVNKAIVTAIGGIGLPGDQGDQGDKGWSPVLAVVTDGVRRVYQIVDWVGGEGTKPATGQYVGATGPVTPIASAVDIRGPVGPAGSVTDGDKGDITVSSSGTEWRVDGGYVRKDTGGSFDAAVGAPVFAIDGQFSMQLYVGNPILKFDPGDFYLYDRTNDKHQFYVGNVERLAITASSAAFSARPTFAGNTPWDSGNFSPASYAALSGATFTGALITKQTGAGWSYLVTDADAGANAILEFRTAGVGRWQISRNSGAAHLYTHRYSAVGAYLDSPSYLDAATGQTVMSVRPTWGATPWDSANLGNFVGDGGSGGSRGLVPAPAAGDAAAGKVLGAGGTWVAGAGAGRTLLRVVQYTAGATWTPLAGTALVCIAVQGGGGGGGAVNGSGTGVAAGAGGGGGGYQERWLSAGWGASQTVTVGSGGAGGTTGSPNGVAGGASSVGTLCVAAGGGGGLGATARVAVDQRGIGPGGDGGGASGTGGTIAGPDVTIPGEGGTIGAIFGTGGTAFSGAGGSSAMGVGGKSVTEGASGNTGVAGGGFGGGGGGACENTSTGRVGGAGSAGIVIITEWA